MEKLSMPTDSNLKEFLDEKYHFYSAKWFIETDPISIPHGFNRKEDIEIAAFLSAIIAWGQRKTIITNANKLITLMEGEPLNFLLNLSPNELKRFDKFVHRTFNGIDCTWFIYKLSEIYKAGNNLENLFSKLQKNSFHAESAISNFKETFLSKAPSRTLKHLADPKKGSTAKRLNMFLRWMVRKDAYGIDFGIWKNIPASNLMLPLDVHTARVGRKLGMLTRTQNDWKAVDELTQSCANFCPEDPVKYDFSLFGLGAFEGF